MAAACLRPSRRGRSGPTRARGAPGRRALARPSQAGPSDFDPLPLPPPHVTHDIYIYIYIYIYIIYVATGNETAGTQEDGGGAERDPQGTDRHAKDRLSAQGGRPHKGKGPTHTEDTQTYRHPRLDVYVCSRCSMLSDARRMDQLGLFTRYCFTSRLYCTIIFFANTQTPPLFIFIIAVKRSSTRITVQN